MENVAFPGSEVAQASFSIIPKYGQIDLYMRGSHIGSVAEPITNITISMDVGPNDRIITPINSSFIGTDIARTADIPTTTSQLTNDSNFITSTELATKQDKLDSYSDSASVANDKLTINYKVKQEDGTYSNVPVEFSGGSSNSIISEDGLEKIVMKNTGAEIYGKNDFGSLTSYGIIKGDTSGPHRERSIQIKPGNTNGIAIQDNAGYADDKNVKILPIGNYPVDIGKTTRKFETLYCNNLSDGTTTKTMTEVISGTTEE